MTIQAIQGGLWIPNSSSWSVALPAFASMGNLSAAADRQAYIFQIPKSGTLDWFEWRQLVNSNTPDNGVRISFQDVDAAGKPDNTEDQYTIITAGFGANVWHVPPSYMGAGGPGFGAKRAVTKGDWIACVLRFENFVASDNISIATLNLPNRQVSNFQLNAYLGQSGNSGGTWSTAANGSINIALKYDDGTYACLDAPNLPIKDINTRAFNSGSTPDERGLLFQVPFPARLAGVWARLISSAAFDLVLYNAAGTAIATETIPFNNIYSSTGANAFYPFATPQSLTKNVDYRVVLKPGGSNISLYDMDFNSSAIRAANPGGSTWMSTSRTNAGAWTDTNTSLPFMGLVFDGFDDATGGGSGGEHSAVF